MCGAHRLHNQFLLMDATITSLTLGRQWLLQMGRAAQKHGIRLQYCMAFPRFFLQVGRTMRNGRARKE
jgi:hypothetical protein